MKIGCVKLLAELEAYINQSKKALIENKKGSGL